MKHCLSLAALGCALSTSVANAATLSVTQYPQTVYAIFIDGESTVFNALGFSAKPNGGATFRNVTSATVWTYPRPPGFPFTYRNRFLSEDPIEVPESKNWTLLGINN